jgi:hypothetical protein
MQFFRVLWHLAGTDSLSLVYWPDGAIEGFVESGEAESDFGQRALGFAYEAEMRPLSRARFRLPTRALSEIRHSRG